MIGFGGALEAHQYVPVLVAAVPVGKRRHVDPPHAIATAFPACGTVIGDLTSLAVDLAEAIFEGQPMPTASEGLFV
jgi:hypothetical protein